MGDLISASRRPEVWLGVLVLLATLAYVPGLNGPFLFDDHSNLSSLSWIQNDPGFYNLAKFVMTGGTGDLGRPLSLLTFGLQYASWDDRPQDFIAVNILIHVLNALLWYQILGVLQRARALPGSQMFRLVIAAFWLLMPIHAATVLYVVQRMAMLATLCLLAGLLLYLKGRLEPASDFRRYAYMACGLFVSTILGTLCKENGALSPLLILVLEGTLLAGTPRPRGWAYGSAVLLWLPSAVLLGYLSLRMPDYLSNYSYRPFTLGERLLTEGRVLFLYLFDALLPHGSVRMLYDDLPISKSLLDPPTTLISLAAWVALVVAGIATRRSLPAVGFGVAWYLVGQLLESTVIPLEIAFTHRSYLPLLGVSLAVSCVARQLALSYAAQRLRTFVSGAVAVYLLLLLGCVWQAAALWGEPVQQAMVWVRTQPDSERAVLTLGNMLLKRHDVPAAYNLYRSAWSSRPADGVFAVSVFAIECVIRNNHVPVAKVAESLRAYEGPEVVSAVITIQNVVARLVEGNCQGHRPADIVSLIDAMLANPVFLRTASSLYYNGALALDAAGDRPGALASLEKAIQVDPRIPLLQQAAFWCVETGNLSQARHYLQMMQSPGISARQRWLFRQEISGTQQLIEWYESLHHVPGTREDPA